MNRIMCFFRGHKYECAIFLCAAPSIVPHSVAIDLFGNVHRNPAFIMGFTHYGLVAKCARCGHINYAPEMALPVVYPEFMNEPVTASPATSARNAKPVDAT
mgnify:CR=1 FL=1